MRALAAQASGRGIRNGLLLASVDGQKLYSHLGWSTIARVLMLSASHDGSDLSLS
jgi:hypothetical protein